MTEILSLGPWPERFLTEHIVTERNLATNTQESYRDALKLLLPFISRKARKPVDRLVVRDLTGERVLQFLAELEDDRGCSAQTEGYAADRTVEQLRKPAQRVADRIDALIAK